MDSFWAMQAKDIVVEDLNFELSYRLTELKFSSNCYAQKCPFFPRVRLWTGQLVYIIYVILLQISFLQMMDFKKLNRRHPIAWMTILKQTLWVNRYLFIWGSTSVCCSHQHRNSLYSQCFMLVWRLNKQIRSLLKWTAAVADETAQRAIIFCWWAEGKTKFIALPLSPVWIKVAHIILLSSILFSLKQTSEDVEGPSSDRKLL